MAKRTNGREFLQLAEPYVAAKHGVGGYFISEKLDGTRCFWDGGLSRGVPTDEVPWASIIDPKTGQKKAKIKPVATGLWSRYGNPIIAPDEFLNQLPCCLLDGELFAGRGNFQLCRSICGGDTPDPRFMAKITYAVYSSPPLSSVFATGDIKNSNFHLAMDFLVCEQWVRQRLPAFGASRRRRGDFIYLPSGVAFLDEIRFLHESLDNLDPDSKCYLHRQTKLSDDSVEAARQVEETLQKVLDLGGEGVVMRNPQETWIPKRHKGVLKYKPYKDAEAVITGFTSGRKTDKGSKHLGRIGALVTCFNNQRLELSGMKDFEREFETDAMRVFALDHPGVDMPSGFQGRSFKIGRMVTFKFRELSDGGVPKDARYWRRRDVE
jgi:hypothetical protein